jgi:hypothetical protein
MTLHTISPGLSGKLMAPAADIVDAEFEMVSSPRPVTPQVRRTAVPPMAGMDTLRRPARPARQSRRAGPAFWTGGMMLALAAFWVSGGYAAFIGAAIAPTTAFSLTDVTSRVDVSGHRPIILIDGTAANEGSATAVLPDLEIRVADLAGSVTRFRLGTSSRSLGSGERFAFSSRLDAPMDGVKSVAVSFAE